MSGCTCNFTPVIPAKGTARMEESRKTSPSVIPAPAEALAKAG
ncbi:MAG: hypothetical protein OEY94_03285 [Alphaproteobacteria bacterium]|nr:hypothetical protein [Alphaproteobacteria bacterium]